MARVSSALHGLKPAAIIALDDDEWEVLEEVSQKGGALALRPLTIWKRLALRDLCDLGLVRIAPCENGEMASLTTEGRERLAKGRAT